MNKKKLTKGMYGFFSHKKRVEILKTTVFFAICLAVYFMGLILTKTNKNLLTIVAILGVLPAAKAAVGMIMVVRFKPIAMESYQQIETYKNQYLLLYDLVFILEEKAVKTECVAVYENTICILTSCKFMKEGEIAGEIKKFLSNHGKGLCNVLVVKDIKTYVRTLNKKKVSDEPSMEKELPKDDTADKATIAEQKIKDMLLGFSM